MLDIKFIRENPEKVKEAAKSKRIDLDIVKIIEADKDYRELQTAVQKIQEQQNSLSKSIKGKPTDEQIAEGKKLKEKFQK